MASGGQAGFASLSHACASRINDVLRFASDLLRWPAPVPSYPAVTDTSSIRIAGTWTEPSISRVSRETAGDRLEHVVEVAGDLDLADRDALALLEQEAALHDAGELSRDRVARPREAGHEHGALRLGAHRREPDGPADTVGATAPMTGVEPAPPGRSPAWRYRRPGPRRSRRESSRDVPSRTRTFRAVGRPSRSNPTVPARAGSSGVVDERERPRRDRLPELALERALSGADGLGREHGEKVAEEELAHDLRREDDRALERFAALRRGALRAS